MENFEQQQYSEIIERDSKAEESYIENIYSRKFAPPEKSKTTFWSIVGIDAALYTISGIGAAILSGIRTGGLFYILEQTLLTEYNLGSAITGSLSTASLVTSLLAFEGFLLATGFSSGRRKGKVTVSKWSLFIAFLVVMSAGIFSGLGIINTTDQVSNILNVVLALVTAVGAGIVTYFGGENIGYSFHFFNEKKKELVEEYKEEYNEWREKALRSYGLSRYNIYGKKYKAMMQKDVDNDKIAKNTEFSTQEALDEKLEKATEELKPHYDAIAEEKEIDVKDHYEEEKKEDGKDGW